MNRSKIAASTMITAAILVAGAATASADYGTQGYNTVVTKFNGNGYSGAARKSFTDDAGYIYSSSVGGGYSLDARMQSTDGVSLGSEWARIKSGSSGPLHNWLQEGIWVRVHFSSDVTTPVNVQVIGSWYEA